jgi:hypothetical protein
MRYPDWLRRRGGMAKRRAGATKRWAVARAVEWAFVGLELPFYSARWMRRAKYLTQEFFFSARDFDAPAGSVFPLPLAKLRFLPHQHDIDRLLELLLEKCLLISGSIKPSFPKQSFVRSMVAAKCK